MKIDVTPEQKIILGEALGAHIQRMKRTKQKDEYREAQAVYKALFLKSFT